MQALPLPLEFFGFHQLPPALLFSGEDNSPSRSECPGDLVQRDSRGAASSHGKFLSGLDCAVAVALRKDVPALHASGRGHGLDDAEDEERPAILGLLATVEQRPLERSTLLRRGVPGLLGSGGRSLCHVSENGGKWDTLAICPFLANIDCFMGSLSRRKVTPTLFTDGVVSRERTSGELPTLIR